MPKDTTIDQPPTETMIETPIQADQIAKPQEPVQLPEEPTGVDPSGFMGSLQPPQAPDRLGELEAKDRQLRERLEGGLEGRLGRADRLKQAEEEAGLAEKEERLSGIREQMAQLSGEFQRQEADVVQEGRARTGAFVTGRKGLIRSRMAAETGALSAIASAIQGDIASAKQKMERALDLEFQDDENKIQNTLQFLELNRQDLSAEQQAVAEKRKAELQQQQAEIDFAKEERAGIMSLAMMMGKNGAPNDVIQNVLNSGSQEEAMTQGSEYLQEQPTDLELAEFDLKRRNVESNIRYREFSKQIALQRQQNSTAKGKPPTQAQQKAANFANGMQQALLNINELEEEGFIGNELFTGVAAKFRGDKTQRLKQAQNSFIENYLRPRSGAAIAESEYDTARDRFFPKFGDGDLVVAQKKKDREMALKGLMLEADTAFTPDPNVFQPDLTNEEFDEAETVAQQETFEGTLSKGEDQYLDDYITQKYGHSPDELLDN